MLPFEKPEVWQKAIDFADSVSRLTRGFPEDERFGLTSQMRQAAVSIASNIADGSARYSRDDFSHFLEIATGSWFEVVTQATIGQRRKFLTQAQYNELHQATETQSHMLSGLRRSLTET